MISRLLIWLFQIWKAISIFTIHLYGIIQCVDKHFDTEHRARGLAIQLNLTNKTKIIKTSNSSSIRLSEINTWEKKWNNNLLIKV